MTICRIYKENHPSTPKKVVNVFDLGYLGIEKDFSGHYHTYQIERKETCNCPRSKKNTTKIITKKMKNSHEHTICRLKKYRIMGMRYLETD